MRRTGERSTILRNNLGEAVISAQLRTSEVAKGS